MQTKLSTWGKGEATIKKRIVVGHKLKSLRDKKSVTLEEEVSQHTGVSISYLSRIESRQVNTFFDNLAKAGNLLSTQFIVFF